MARTQATKLFRNYFTFGHVAIVGFTLCSAEIIRYQDFVFFKTRICASTMFFAFTTNVLAGELVRINAIVTLYLFIFSAERTSVSGLRVVLRVRICGRVQQIHCTRSCIAAKI